MTLRRRFRHYFVTGLFVVVPVGVSLLALGWFVVAVDGLLGPPVAAFLGRSVPGLGLLALVLLVVWAGWLASNLSGRVLIDWIERTLLIVPGLSWMYRTLKQIAEAFSPEAPMGFRNVVLVEYPRLGAWAYGFVTKEFRLDRGADRVDDMVAVYIPTNHFYIGDYRLLKKSEVLATPLNVQEGIQIALSAGAATPETLSALPSGSSPS